MSQAPTSSPPGLLAPPPAATSSAPLDPAQYQQLELARQRAKKIRRAATVASISGWAMLVFGGFSLLGGLFSVSSFLLGVGLGLVGWLELQGAKKLKVFDVAAPKHLALNQIAVAAVIIGYAGWSIGVALLGPGLYESQKASMAIGGDMLESVENLHRVMMVGFYAVVIVVSLIAQGSAAIYYLTRRRHLVDFLSQTPSWVTTVLRAVG